MPICSALQKYGYSNFSLVILEYCDPSECLARENHFLASLKPEYNIAKDAQAPFFNRLHTPETKAKMSEAQAGRNHTPETRGLMSILKTGENNPMYGRTGEKHPM
jgi:group I intron endonuclease